MEIEFYEAKHSPYISRRNFFLRVKNPSRDDVEGLEILKDAIKNVKILEKAWLLIRKRCKYCNGSVCARHGTIEDFINSFFVSPPTRTRILTVSFKVRDKDRVTLKELRAYIEGSGWDVRGDSEKIVVKRPNGLAFTYRNYTWEWDLKCTYWLFLAEIALNLWPLLPYALV